MKQLYMMTVIIARKAKKERKNKAEIKKRNLKLKNPKKSPANLT